MAEIKIAKKKPIWPWITLVVIVLAILAYLFLYENEEDDSIDDMDEIEELNDGPTTSTEPGDNTFKFKTEEKS